MTSMSLSRPERKGSRLDRIGGRQHATRYSNIQPSSSSFASTPPRPNAACLARMICRLEERICSLHIRRFQGNAKTHAILFLCRVEAKSIQAIPVVEQAD